jgi:hypothetical protein
MLWMAVLLNSFYLSQFFRRKILETHNISHYIFIDFTMTVIINSPTATALQCKNSLRLVYTLASISNSKEKF